MKMWLQTQSLIARSPLPHVDPLALWILDPSHVILAIGLKHEQAHGSMDMSRHMVPWS